MGQEDDQGVIGGTIRPLPAQVVIAGEYVLKLRLQRAWDSMIRRASKPSEVPA